MRKDTIDMELPSEGPEELPRDCRMSLELYQNARQTMGELRDLLRSTGMSWDFIQTQIDAAQTPPSPIDKALGRMDDYSTGPGRSLEGKPRNVW